MSRIAKVRALLTVEQLRKVIFSSTAQRFALAMSGAIVARLGLLLMASLVGRQFGPADYGAFTFSTSIALLCAQIAIFGWPMMVNRKIPEMIRDQHWGHLRGLRDSGDALIFLTATLFTILLLVGSRWSGRLADSLILSAMLVTPFAFAILRRQQMTAVRLSAVGLLFDQGFGALLTAVVMAIFALHSIFWVVSVYSAGIILGIIITSIIFIKRMPAEMRTAKRQYEFKAWISIALPLLLGMSAKLLMNKVDILLLAPLSGLHESGLYGAAFRVTFLLSFPQTVMMTVLIPMISKSFADGRDSDVSRLLKIGLAVTAATAIPTSLPFLLLPGDIMAFIFGEAFRSVAPTLVVLTLAQLANSFSAPLGSVLMMGGRERSFGILNASGLVMNVIFNLALIPFFGAFGAAVATLVSSLFVALGQIILKRH